MKRILFTLSVLALALGAGAKTITPEEALQRAVTFGPAKAKGLASPALVYTSVCPDGNPAVYVFSRGPESGYMLLGADDAAYPVLGYADSGSFDEDGMAPAMKWWLEEYGRQMALTSSSSFRPATRKEAPAGRTPIAPMIATKWDQGAPYNNKCPLLSGYPTWTGCVATSMSQVMNYWQFPERGTGSLSYNCETLDKRLTLDLGRQPKFDWANMRQTYLPGQYTDEEADAVARLMVCAAYSVKMEFSTDASGALAMNIAKALVKNFGYDASAKYHLRHMYSTSEWEALIYEGLKTGPVIYGGDSYLGGGHSFICDGYDGEGFFHFNWGWSGMSDGYFLLDAITPGALGAGGGGGGGYTFTQDAVIGIQPSKGTEVAEEPVTLTQMGSLNGKVSMDGNLYFSLTGQEDPMWVNYNPESLEVQFGARFDSADGSYSQVLPLNGKSYTLEPGYGTSPAYILEVGNESCRVDLETAAPADGAYTVTMMQRNVKEEEWTELPAAYGYSNFFSLTREDDWFEVQNNPANDLTILDGGLKGTTYYGCLANPWITLRNDSPIELNKGFAPIIFWKDDSDGQYYIFFLGESVMISLAPGEETTREWTTSLYLMQNISMLPGTEFYLTWFDESTYTVYDSAFLKKVSILDNPGTVQLIAPDGVSIEGYDFVNELTGISRQKIYLVTDPLNIPVTCPLAIGANSPADTYEYTTYAAVTAYGDSTFEILNMAGAPMSFDSNTENPVFSVNLQLPTAVVGKLYMVSVCYQYGSYYLPAYATSGNNISYAFFRVTDNASVESLRDVGEENAPIFNLQGMNLGTDARNLPAGLYIRNGKKFIKN